MINALCELRQQGKVTSSTLLNSKRQILWLGWWLMCKWVNQIPDISLLCVLQVQIKNLNLCADMVALTCGCLASTSRPCLKASAVCSLILCLVLLYYRLLSHDGFSFQGDTPQAMSLARGIVQMLRELQDKCQKAVAATERSGTRKPAHTIVGKLDQAQRWLANPSVDDKGLG